MTHWFCIKDKKIRVQLLLIMCRRSKFVEFIKNRAAEDLSAFNLFSVLHMNVVFDFWLSISFYFVKSADLNGDTLI